jgi:hypothetical protein
VEGKDILGKRKVIHRTVDTTVDNLVYKKCKFPDVDVLHLIAYDAGKIYSQ